MTTLPTFSPSHCPSHCSRNMWRTCWLLSRTCSPQNTRVHHFSQTLYQDISRSQSCDLSESQHRDFNFNQEFVRSWQGGVLICGTQVHHILSVICSLILSSDYQVLWQRDNSRLVTVLWPTFPNGKNLNKSTPKTINKHSPYSAHAWRRRKPAPS